MDEIYHLIGISAVVVSAIVYVYFINSKRTAVTKTLMPTYCEACNTRVEYNYKRNCYFCPKHGKLIFLNRGIPIELISGWYRRLEEAEG